MARKESNHNRSCGQRLGEAFRVFTHLGMIVSMLGLGVFSYNRTLEYLGLIDDLEKTGGFNIGSSTDVAGFQGSGDIRPITFRESGERVGDLATQVGYIEFMLSGGPASNRNRFATADLALRRARENCRVADFVGEQFINRDLDTEITAAFISVADCSK